MDDAAFGPIQTEVAKDKQDLRRYEELGGDLDEYLSTMEDNEEWKRVSDADCMDFLLKSIPERLEHVNTQLKTKLLTADEQSYEIIQANAKKQKVLEQINEEKEKRKILKDKIQELSDANKEAKQKINLIESDIF